MVFTYACLLLQRVVIPVALVVAALLRPVGISFVYLLMFFISPFIPIATNRNFKGSVTAYFIILIALTTIIILCHIALQVTIISLKIGDLFESCSFTEQLLRHIGFIDFRNLYVLAIVEWLVPEVVVFITSLACYLVTKKLTAKDAASQLESGQVEALPNGAENEDTQTAVKAKKHYQIKPLSFDRLIRISPIFCLATLFISAVLRPSVPGGFYFLIFLLSGSYWATFQSLKRGFAYLMRFVLIVIVLHILCLIAYQIPWFQDHLDEKSLIARLIGLEAIISSNCKHDIRILVYDTKYNIESFLNPFVLFTTYFVLALTSKNLVIPRVSLRREQHPMITDPTETTPLVRHTTRKTGHSTFRAASNLISDTGDHPSNNNPDDEQGGTSLVDQIVYGFLSVGGFIYQNSYIFTNILMMAWSIVYHSWLTFVLLLWGNGLWMIPNQRKAMMRSSPLIVIYCELLLIAQYIYGMDLTNDELPSKVETTGINLAQIGLERPRDYDMRPCVPLIVKSTFVLMFWITCRQFFKEKSDKRKESSLAGMMAPLNLTASGATSIDRTDAKKSSKFLKKTGGIIKNLLVRLWIWLLVLVIFLCAITGKQMTGFRICYMALFLFFLLVFQSSSKAWVKIMYGFWLFLIIYAMSILILIYTYQFDKFDQYWMDYLNISKTLQSDIGLERYKTKDLFLHLVSPTLIVILTVIQVHYFHKRFIASLQESSVRGSVRLTQSKAKSLSIGLLTQEFEVSFEKSLRDLIKQFFKSLQVKGKRLFKNLKNIIWRFLELHFIKLVYIAAFACGVSEVCVLHIVIICLCLLGVIARTGIQTFLSRIMSFIVTIIVLAKMIYQIAYLNHNLYDVTCKYNNVTSNNAAWFGLTKATASDGLMGLLKKYIIYMIMVTLHAVISMRQSQMSIATKTESVPKSKVLFPGIKRADAEKNLKGMIKYLFNYGFFKFGIEISLIFLVATIAYRQDIIAVAYAVWLLVLIVCTREKLEYFWGIFQCFLAVSILLQYVVLVGLPPGLCTHYPWINTEYSESMQFWAMLPGDLHYNHVPKLIFDFILLMIVNRQKRVFYTENHLNMNYPYSGGNNRSVVDDIANLGKIPFHNPTRDFLGTIRNYLDVFKNAILCGFYWVTLAVVFLAGTNIADLLALGYLIGAFIFLWEGSDFYLRPIHTIIKRWRWLIIYNVFNIVIKTCFQMVGCIFMDVLTENCCWLIHLLTVTCHAKNLPQDIDDFSDGDCPSTKGHRGLLWDAICFGFLLFQYRIFTSHYICHIITDTKANNILASRGAEIIEDLRQKQIHHRQELEKEVLLKIKRKMEKIRATQQKMLKPIDRPTHFDEYGRPLADTKLYKRKEIKFHPHAVRAGDYYMFDDMDEKFELDLIEDSTDFLDVPDKIDETTKKLNRRKTLIDEKLENEPIPSTSEEAQRTLTDSEREREKFEEDKKKDTDEADMTEKDTDAELAANPIVRLLVGFLVSLTLRLNRFSRNYRYVNKILIEEKRLLKESADLHKMNKNTTSMGILKKTTDRQEASEMPFASQSNIVFEEEDFTQRDHNIIIEVLMASYFAILSNTDLICYIVVFINQVVNASIISLPLPFMVFLWGTLSLPRPTKTFWVTMIAYTQAIVLVKCIFQFKLIWANYTNLPNQPLAPAKLFGVELDPNYASYYLLLLLVLFFHRFILKSQGVWRSEVIDDSPQKSVGTTGYSADDVPKIVGASEDEIIPADKGKDEDTNVSLKDSDELSEESLKRPYLESLRTFFSNLVNKPRLPSDVYALMFLCDFINFFVLLFGFTAFGTQQTEGDGGVQTYLAENKVPIPFLIMLLVQFILIVIDRALYLRKALVPKIIFHVFSVIGIHIWMFFIVPLVTERSFYTSSPPVIFYIVKCLYLLFSSYQIKCGYPKRILGNFLTKGFSLVNMISFKVYMQIPFLYELRTILDWVSTDTTMTLFDWLKMEDIFADIYFIKCSRQMETDFPAIRAEKKALLTKLLMGGTIILLIVIAIWGPLCLFALGNTVGQPNVPYEVSLQVRIGSYDPIYMSQNREGITQFDETMFAEMQHAYIKDKSAITFLSNYDAGDIAAIKLAANSPTLWSISPPDKERLLYELKENMTLVARFTYSLTRVPPVKNSIGTVGSEIPVKLRENFVGRETMIKMLEGTEVNEKVFIPDIIPKFIKVLNSGESYIIHQLMPRTKTYSPMYIRMLTMNNESWWEIGDVCDDPFYISTLSKLQGKKEKDDTCEPGIIMYTFNDKKFPSTFSFFTAGGIIGLYTTFVLLASRFLKSFIGGQNRKIMFEDLPYVDRVLQLCLDIYLVREALEFALEEDLFAKLLFLYRSPETMIKWTRPKEELVEDDTDTESLPSRSSGRRDQSLMQQQQPQQ